MGFLGVWVGRYGDEATSSDLVTVAYYHAEPIDDSPGSADGVETDEVAWFAERDLPSPGVLAPPDRFPAVLDDWRTALRAGETVTPLRDRPSRAAR